MVKWIRSERVPLIRLKVDSVESGMFNQYRIAMKNLWVYFCINAFYKTNQKDGQAIGSGESLPFR
ncbi:MAG: hypothetical protein ACI4E1_07230 [Lachnospira sp.]